MVATALTRAAALAAGTLVLAGPVTAQPAPAAAETPGGEPAARAQIRTLERVLAGAVSRSASAVEGQLPAGVPGLVLFAGPIQVRGFRLEDYGVFFDVEYPVLRRSIVWSMQRPRPVRAEPGHHAADVAPNVPARGPFRSAAGRLGAPPTRATRRVSPPAGHHPGTGRAVIDPLGVYQQALQVSLTDALVLGGAALGAMLPEDALAHRGRAGRHRPGRSRRPAPRRVARSRRVRGGSHQPRRGSGTRGGLRLLGL